MKSATAALEINDIALCPTFSQTTSEPSDSCSLHFELTDYNDLFNHVTVMAPLPIVATVFHQAAFTQQPIVQAHGFVRGEVPLDYIKQNFKENLIEHVKELILKQFVIPFLYQQIRLKKLLVAGDPRLMHISLDPDADATFVFEFTKAPVIAIENWKYLPFKAPKRKNYKDLDRQVETFLNAEREQYEQYNPQKGIQLGDWINFDLFLTDQKNIILYGQNFWFKLSMQDGEDSLRELFLGKKSGDSFITDSNALQDYFSSNLETNYPFLLNIIDIIPHAYFCVEQFKTHFRLKNNKEIHQKFIEVFSFRNDICLRRSMVEETLKLLLSKNNVVAPNHVIARQEKIVLEAVQENSDYHIYRIQKNFYQHIRNLAERQARELILIDQFTVYENLTIADQEVKNYLSFFNRPRMKEFIYAELPPYKIQGQEVPIAAEIVKQCALREKTVNHLIYHLTKK